MLTFSALALLSLPQTPATQSVPRYRTTGAPQYAGVYHPTRGLDPGAPRSRFGPEVIWNAHRLGNYYTIPGSNQEWIDEGILPQRHTELTEQINGMRFTYCSQDPNPNGLDGVVRFYEETVICGGPPSWPSENCQYEVIGLPGASQAGIVECWTVDLDLSGVECNLGLDVASQQHFGWSVTWESDLTGPWLMAAPMPPGGDCSWVWYDRNESNPNQAFLGCYWFGCIPLEQFTCALFGQPPEVFAESSQDGPGADDSLSLHALTGFVAGQSPVVEVRRIGRGTLIGGSQVWASKDRVDIDLQCHLGLDAHLLVSRNHLVWDDVELDGVHETGTIPPWMVGQTYYLQAAQPGGLGPIALSANALRVTVQ